jgi:hypothetical protein
MRLNGGGAETYRKWFMKTIDVLERDQLNDHKAKGRPR